MIRRLLLVMLVAFFVATLSGCNTVKGAATGTAAAVYLTGKGVVDDAYYGYQTAEKADTWFQENYW